MRMFPATSLVLASAAWLLGAGEIRGQTAGAPTGTEVLATLPATLVRLTIKIPMEVAERDPVRQPLDELTREKCDQKAIMDLGKALQKVGYKRDAANAHISFSAACGGHAPSLRMAVNILLGLSDHTLAAAVASDLIELEPFDDNGYFLRAVAYSRGHQPKKAIDDYITAIELFPEKQQISSASYEAMAQAYEKLGQFCDAAGAIDAWVAIDPASHDNSQTQAIIADYRRKGSCAVGQAGRPEVFSMGSGGVSIVQVEINGVRGNFVLDTGATFVALRASFADLARVDIDRETVVKLHTANGVADGRRGRARSVQLRSLKAENVPLVVQADAQGTYGKNVDGLLGMSFLSRFQIAMDGKRIRIASRGGEPVATAPAQTQPGVKAPAPPSAVGTGAPGSGGPAAGAGTQAPPAAKKPKAAKKDPKPFSGIPGLGW